MKKLLSFILVSLTGMTGFGQQSITLSFTAMDAQTSNMIPLQQVYIHNMTAGCDTTIYGPTPSITLIVVVGIHNNLMNPSEDFTLLSAMPNPFFGSTVVRLDLHKQGPLTLFLSGISGKKLFEYKKTLDAGVHQFTVSSSGDHLMFLNASNGRINKTIKLMNLSDGIAENCISYIGKSDQTANFYYKSLKVSGFIYNFGDLLSYTGSASGYCNMTIADSPTHDTTYTFIMSASPTVPTVTTSPVTNITQTTATSGGNVTSDGGATVTARGVCWSTSPNPTTADNHTIDGSGMGIFASFLAGLTPNTPYYIRAYATNSVGTAYGNELTFSTLANATLPTVTTSPVINITQTTATSGGNVTSDGGASVTARGVCWSTSPNPTTASSYTTDGTGTGIFVSYLTGLNPNTPYYVRAYAINSVGTAYGNELTFTTLAISLPTVTTDSLTNITQTTATSGGDVISDGGLIVTSRGVCWNTSPNPTTANNHTTDGTGTGIFVSNLTGLTLSTLYYVRAYATNSLGTAYGNELSFTTLSSFTCGSSQVNYGGQNYNTVQIGTQCWFKENLNVGSMINGSQNQTNNSIIEKYCYNNLDSYCTIYGGLYQWDEAMQYTTIQGAQGICPSGWHLPTDAEWTTLTTYLGGLSAAGGELKETGYTHWNPPNTGATNSSGFTALPNGDRDSGGAGFYNLGDLGYFWSSTEYPTSYAYNRRLNYNNTVVYANYSGKTFGFGARCLKD